MLEADQIESLRARIAEIMPLAPIDTRNLARIGEGGESIVYQAPPDYRVPGHPEIKGNQVVIKAMRPAPSGAGEPIGARRNLLYCWLRISQALSLSAEFQAKYPSLSPRQLQLEAVRQILDILYPQGQTQHADLLRFDEIYGSTSGLVDKINALTARLGVEVNGNLLRPKAVFAPIYGGIGITEDLHFFMTMAKVDQMLLESMRPPGKKIRFQNFSEADKKLRFPEIVALLTLIHNAGFVLGDLKFENIGISPESNLIFIDPTSLTPLGKPVLVFTHSMLPPDVQKRIESKSLRLPIADPELDRYAALRIRQLSISTGI